MADPTQVPQINYCYICERFYASSSCPCAQIFSRNDKKIVLPFASELAGLTLIERILYVVFLAVYSYTSRILKPSVDCPPNLALSRLLVRRQSKKQITVKVKLDQRSICAKYIHLVPHNEPSAKIKRNFCVYMMMAIPTTPSTDDASHPQVDQQPASPESTKSSPRADSDASPSTSTLASKSTGALSRLTKSLKRKMKFDDALGESSAQTHVSLTHPAPKIHKIRSKSKIPVATARYDAGKFDSEIALGRKASASSSQRRLIFRQTPGVVKSEPGSPAISAQSSPEMSKHDLRSRSCVKIDNRGVSRTSHDGAFSSPAPDQAFLDFNFDFHYGDGLREAVEFSQRLQEGESRLAHLISKYIQDRSFEKELRDVLADHAKLHLEAERRAQNLVHETWLQQSEMMKAQEAALQENLNAVVRHNRRLQEDIENLTRKNEKLSLTKSRAYPDFSRPDSNNHLLENMSRNNDKLRYRLSAATAQIEESEKELALVQRKNQLHEQQLRNSSSQLQTHKAMLQRIQADNELEHAHLSHQLQLRQLTIKETAEAGDVLLEDLDALKRQMKTIPCNLNWTKFKSRGSSLPDLIYMCRSCINELAKVILTSHTEVVLRDKDLNGARDEIRRLEESLENARAEQDSLNCRLKAAGVQEADLKRCLAKCSGLERELAECRQHIEQTNQEFDKERLDLMASFDNMEALNKKIIEKDEELILSKEKTCEYKAENDTLRMQLHGLKQVLAASGSGDVARELADSQEKLTFFQSQYYQLLSEKNYLIEQLQTANQERGALNQFQNTYYQFIQAQQQDLEMLNRDNLVMRQELDVERNQVASLQMDKSKLKEEKSVMRQIYQQLKNEIGRVQDLQGEMFGMNVEANKLAIIAEYNRQLGEKLQSEVAERDVKIYRLETSVGKLNSAQLESTKDKVALCVELNEVCTINDRLNTSLVAEHRKTAHLDESKKRLENTANTQLKSLEDMQRAERAALKELLKDYKNVVTQRDNLVAVQSEYHQQIGDLRANAVGQARSLKSATTKCSKAVETIEKLELKLQDSEKELKAARDKIAEEESGNAELQRQLQQAKVQKDALESSKTYLQNTIQKLHHDLNDSRKAESELRPTLKELKKKTEILNSTLVEKEAALTRAEKESESLTRKLDELNQVHDKLFVDYKAKATDAAAKEGELQKSLHDTKTLLEISDTGLKQLEDVIAEKDLQLAELKEYCKDLIEEVRQMEASAEDMASQSKLLFQNNAELVRLQHEHNGCTETITTLKREKHALESSLKAQLAELEANCSHHQVYADEILQDYVTLKSEMAADLQVLAAKLQDSNKNCEIEKNAHSELLESHKSLAARLLKAVRMLIDEKLSRQSAEGGAAKLMDKNKKLAWEKSAAEENVELLRGELEELRSKMAELSTDKKSLQELVSELRALYKKSETQLVGKLEDTKKRRKISSSRRSNKALKETKSNLQASEERSKKLKVDLEKAHSNIMRLKSHISDLKQQLTVMEFQKCEVALRLHETEAKFKTEQTMNQEYTGIHQQVLAEILKMKREGAITRPVTETLLGLVQGQLQTDVSCDVLRQLAEKAGKLEN